MGTFQGSHMVGGVSHACYLMMNSKYFRIQNQQHQRNSADLNRNTYISMVWGSNIAAVVKSKPLWCFFVSVHFLSCPTHCLVWGVLWCTNYHAAFRCVQSYAPASRNRVISKWWQRQACVMIPKLIMVQLWEDLIQGFRGRRKGVFQEEGSDCGWCSQLCYF